MTVTAVNQLWVADITYIHLRTEFVLLAVVIDRCSRKAIGWALDRSPTARVAVTALEQAIGQRQPPPGVVHHSDRGTQYASAEYASSWRAHRQEGWCCWGGRPVRSIAGSGASQPVQQVHQVCRESHAHGHVADRILQNESHPMIQAINSPIVAPQYTGVVGVAFLSIIDNARWDEGVDCWRPVQAVRPATWPRPLVLLVCVLMTQPTWACTCATGTF